MFQIIDFNELSFIIKNQTVKMEGDIKSNLISMAAVEYIKEEF
jgi:hypothetical protein